MASRRIALLEEWERKVAEGEKQSKIQNCYANYRLPTTNYQLPITSNK
ncbi:hypothetical protein [Chroococcidiopsis sp.]